MAIEWWARANRAFTLVAAAHLTGQVVGELLHAPLDEPVVEVVEASQERLRGGKSGPVAREVLTILRDPVGDPAARHAYVVFRVPALPALAYVLLGEYVPRDEDSESGMLVTVTSARTNESQVLSIAAACAFAELADSEVIDESGYFKGQRLTPPRELVGRLRVAEPTTSVSAAVESVLRQTTLRWDYEPLCREDM